MSGGFGDLLRTRGVARIIAAQLVARFPSGMLSLGLLFHVERRTGSYAAAGVVLAALSIGQAISGPATGRLMGRLGIRPVRARHRDAVRRSGRRDRARAISRTTAIVALAFAAGITFPPITAGRAHDLSEARELADARLRCSRSTRRCRS